MCFRDLEETRGAQVRRRRAHPEVYAPCLDEPGTFVCRRGRPERQLLGREAERHPLARTRREIEEERYALKALRGDFSGLPPDARIGLRVAR